MAYISQNYMNHPDAPVGKWACAPESNQGPYSSVPPSDLTRHPGYCGHCVSYVKTVCPGLPATAGWIKGAKVVKGYSIVPGTVIATFDSNAHYLGHAAIYVNQSDDGITVYDQWVTPPNPKAIGPRLLRWDGNGVNKADSYYVVE